MYAIIRTGGKQAKVSPGDVIEVERLKGAGEEVEFTPLLVVTDKGKAITDREELSAVKVLAKVLGEVKGDKVDVFKYKPKTGYRRSMGHRQKYTRIEISEIKLPKAASKKSSGAKKPKAETEPAEEQEAAAEEA